MSQTAKRKRPRKPAKEKDGLSRQTSLWDAFGIKFSSKKNTPVASAATSENESVGTNDVVELYSSDVEPNGGSDALIVGGPASSSPPSMDGQDSSTTSEPVASGSKDVPIIVIDSSPSNSPVLTRKAQRQQPPKALYSIFASRKPPDNRSSSRKPAPRGTNASAAPFPDLATQHVRGPQTVFHLPLPKPPPRLPREPPDDTQGSFNYSRLVRGAVPHDEDKPTSLPSPNRVLAYSDSRERVVSSLPVVHRNYPALARFFTEHSTVPGSVEDPSVAAHSLWNDKWRPRRADQVLGNEQSALYLRDWLLALKLHINTSGTVLTPSPSTSDPKGKQKAGKPPKRKSKEPRGTKRPRIVRDVQKKRRRVDSEEPEEPWLADDPSDDELLLDGVLESEENCISATLSRLKRADTDDTPGEPPSSLPESISVEQSLHRPDAIGAFSYAPPRFGDTVYNTILLTGPHGCGKTAAVYACAEELGWDVFEVYPGIGERSGAALNKLIGEVGKNHLVKQTQQQPKPEETKPVRPKTSFFAKRVMSDDEAEEPPLTQAPAPGMEEPETAQPDVAPPVVSQSVVLVEEVDVLYKQDVNFWPMLLKIIRECRRPVVLTCNDTALVPIHDLPLQTTLHFSPCPSPLAVSYLQVLCLAENRIADREAIERLYQDRDFPPEEPNVDDNFHPDYLRKPEPDLRRTINQLQLGQVAPAPVRRDTTIRPPASSEDDQSDERLIRIARSASLNSFVDARLRRPGQDLLRDVLSNSAPPSADDQIGYKQLVAEPQDRDSGLPVSFSFYHWDEAMVEELHSYSRTHYPHPALDDPTPHLHPLHAAHCGALLPVLDRLHVPREQLVRDARAVFVEYEPWIRFMSRVDDARIAETVSSGRLEGTRRTRNSQRSQPALERWIFLNDDELAVLGRTALQANEMDA